MKQFLYQLEEIRIQPLKSHQWLIHCMIIFYSLFLLFHKPVQSSPMYLSLTRLICITSKNFSPFSSQDIGVSHKTISQTLRSQFGSFPHAITSAITEYLKLQELYNCKYKQARDNRCYLLQKSVTCRDTLWKINHIRTMIRVSVQAKDHMGTMHKSIDENLADSCFLKLRD